MWSFHIPRVRVESNTPFGDGMPTMARIAVRLNL
jgi:hypothetical protein